MLKLIHTKQLLAILTTFIILGVASNASASPLDVSVTIPPSLNVTLTGTDASGNVSLNLNPATSAFSTRDLTISVGTNNPSGYTLTMTANGTSLIRTEAVSGIYPTIATLASEVAEGSFTTNRWGYRFTDNTTNTNFQPLPGVDPATGITTLPISESDSAVNNKARTITFGAKVDTTQTPGDYELAMTFAATAKPNIMYMQNLTDAQCTTTATDAIDLRDGQAYTIQRLADGKCWMMTNLNLGATDLTTDLTSDNTHLATTVSAATFNGWKKSSGSESYTSAEFIPITASNSSDKSATDSKSGMPYGTLYNYCAASANTYCSNSGTDNATSDLCPKGWRLPIGNTSGEFQALYNKYGSNASMRNPISAGGAAFTLSSIFYDGSPTGRQGSEGNFWSSTFYSGSFMYNLYLDTSSVSPASYSSRANGTSIRCVLQSDFEKDPLTALENGTAYLQDFASLTSTDNTNLLNSMEAGKSYTVKDKRDEQIYTIAKINGNLWMTRNLAIGCNGSGSTYGDTVSSVTLTSVDSNVLTTWSTPTAKLSEASANTETADYTIPRMQCANVNDDPYNEYEAWYNYAAATAGTITGRYNGGSSTYDICPRGWRLPTQSEFNGIISGPSVFSPVYSGYYDSGSLRYSGSYGRWWSSTSSDSVKRYNLDYYSGSPPYVTTNVRYYGFSVRCVRS